VDELHADLKELKADVKELVKQGAIHNVLLKEHEARSLALQVEQKLQASRLSPLEKQYDLTRIIYGALGTLSLAVLGKIVLSALNLL
jgi:hypothetical protein